MYHEFESLERLIKKSNDRLSDLQKKGMGASKEAYHRKKAADHFRDASQNRDAEHRLHAALAGFSLILADDEQ